MKCYKTFSVEFTPKSSHSHSLTFGERLRAPIKGGIPKCAPLWAAPALLEKILTRAVSAVVEQSTHNPKFMGSNPATYCTEREKIVKI